MKTELIVRDGSASLVMTAENDFERKMLGEIEPLSDRSVSVMVYRKDSEYWNRETFIKSAHIEVSFRTTPPQPEPSLSSPQGAAALG